MPDTLFLLWFPTEGAFWKGDKKEDLTTSSEFAHKFLTHGTAARKLVELKFEDAVILPYDVQPVVELTRSQHANIKQS
jgi:hypothetical protein